MPITATMPNLSHTHTHTHTHSHTHTHTDIPTHTYTHAPCLYVEGNLMHCFRSISRSKMPMAKGMSEVNRMLNRVM